MGIKTIEVVANQMDMLTCVERHAAAPLRCPPPPPPLLANARAARKERKE